MHFMLDLETLGTRATAPITQIGIVAMMEVPSGGFVIGRSLEIAVNIVDQCTQGAEIEAETVDWWREQPGSPFLEAVRHCSPAAAMERVNAFILNHCLGDASKAAIWGNGASFDQPLLEAMAHRCRVPPVWIYRASRCLRTFFKLHGRDEAPGLAYRREREHRAIDDAYVQAADLIFTAANRGIELK